MKKLSEKELEQLKSIQENYSKLVAQMGDIEIHIGDHKAMIEQLEFEKVSIREKLKDLRKSDEELSVTLSEKYGSGKINIETGEITEN